jgi:cell division protein FtsL
MAHEHDRGPVAPGGGGDAARPSGRGMPRLTSRAAVLAVVMCAIALSLAYPVREYIAQHRQIDQLEAQHKMEEAQVRSLEAEQQHLNDPAYIEDQARARLNMCLPTETCYVIINGQTTSGLPQPPRAARAAWYVTLWKSVEQADKQAPR